MVDTLKRHLFLIVCGVVGAAGIALGVTSYMSMGKVQTRMNSLRNTYSKLASLERGGVNDSFIEQERQRIKNVMADYDQLMAEAESLQTYQPIVEGLFPDAPDEKVLEFQSAYEAAMAALFSPETLRWGELPDDSRFEFWQDKIASEISREKFDPAISADGKGSEPTFTKGVVLSKAGARYDKFARAYLDAAQKCYLYAQPRVEGRRGEDVVPSLQYFDFEKYKELTHKIKPTPEVLWAVQLQYWLQADAIRAIRAVNDKAATAFRASLEGGETPAGDNEDRSPWVGIMPVKRIISIRTSVNPLLISDEYEWAMYVKPDGPEFGWASPEGGDAAPAAGSSAYTFTHAASDSTCDVLQFSLKLVMDQRDIPKLIDQITANSFHKLLRVTYARPDEADLMHYRNMRWYIYGGEPVVHVLLDFETCMLGDKFRRMMPQSVLDYYGWTRPADENQPQ